MRLIRFNRLIRFFVPEPDELDLMHAQMPFNKGAAAFSLERSETSGLLMPIIGIIRPETRDLTVTSGISQGY